MGAELGVIVTALAALVAVAWFVITGEQLPVPLCEL